MNCKAWYEGAGVLSYGVGIVIPCFLSDVEDLWHHWTNPRWQAVRQVNSLLRVLPLAMVWIVDGTIFNHLNSFTLAGFLGTMLGDHIKLSNMILGSKVTLMSKFDLIFFDKQNLTSSIVSGIHIRYSFRSMIWPHQWSLESNLQSQIDNNLDENLAKLFYVIIGLAIPAQLRLLYLRFILHSKLRVF